MRSIDTIGDTIGRKWLVVLLSSVLIATATPEHASQAASVAKPATTEGRWSRLRTQASLVRDGFRLIKTRPELVKTIVRPGGLSMGRQLLAAPETGRELVALAQAQPKLVASATAARHLPLAIELGRAQPALFRRLVAQLKTRPALSADLGEQGEAALKLALHDPALVHAGLDLFDRIAERHPQALALLRARGAGARLGSLLILAKERPALAKRALALAHAHPEMLERAGGGLVEVPAEAVDRIAGLARRAPRVAEAALSLLESRPALAREMSERLDAAPPGLIVRAASLAERQSALAETTLALLREKPALVDALLDEMKTNPRSGGSFLALAEENPASALAMVRTIKSRPELLDLGLGAARRFPGLARAVTAVAAARPGIARLGAVVLSQVFGR